MTQYNKGTSVVQQALMYLDVLRAELRIAGCVRGQLVGCNGCTFHTLRGALAAFPQWAATWPAANSTNSEKQGIKKRVFVDLVADSTGNDDTELSQAHGKLLSKGTLRVAPVVSAQKQKLLELLE